jgi:predicted metal-binding membrane protein
MPVLTRAARGRGGVLAMLPVIAGYLAVWMVFAVAMTVAGAVLATTRGIDGPMGAMVSTFAATTLFAAGLYQFTPLKRACLDRCRAPARPVGIAALTPKGRFARGLAHGLDCLGCCWALMAAMLAVGIMNIVWMVGLTAVMALEKTLPGDYLRWFIGMGLIGLAVLTFGQSPGGLKLFGLA